MGFASKEKPRLTLKDNEQCSVVSTDKARNRLLRKQNLNSVIIKVF